MIINNHHKFVFIHIPKNGGTSVSTFLSKGLGVCDLDLNIAPNTPEKISYLNFIKENYGLVKHSTYQESKKALNHTRFDGYKYIAVSRNPYSRAKSIYNFTLKADAKHRPNSKRYMDIKDMSFLEFLQSKYMQEYLMIAAKPQSDWIIDSNGNLAQNIKIFKLEELSTSTLSIQKYLYPNDHNDCRLPHKNYSKNVTNNKSSNDAEMLKDEEKSIIRKLYAKDFEFLDYAI